VRAVEKLGWGWGEMTWVWEMAVLGSLPELSAPSTTSLLAYAGASAEHLRSDSGAIAALRRTPLAGPARWTRDTSGRSSGVSVL